MGKLSTYIGRLKQAFTKVGEDVADLRENKADKVMLDNFGGRNYILESNKYHGNNVWYSYGYAWNFLFYVDLKGGETYTVSVPVRNLNNSNDSRSRITVAGLSSSTQTIQPLAERVIKYTFTYPEDQDQVIIRFLTDTPDLPVLEWGLPKLEKGSIPTDWTPAPEDQTADVLEENPLLFSHIKNRDYLMLSTANSTSPLDDAFSGRGRFVLGNNGEITVNGILIPHGGSANNYGTMLSFRNRRAWIKTKENGTLSPLYEFWTTYNFNPSNYATANEINNIYDQLSAKANERLSNVASNLSQSEKDALLGKIGGNFKDFGLGNNANTTGSWDLSSGVTEFISATDHNSPLVGSSGRVWGFKVRYNSNAFGVAMGMRNGRAIFKTRENNVESEWLEFWHSGNLTNPATKAWVTTQIEEIELTPGPQGADGKTWHSGTTNPSNSLGKVGDWHLNRSTWDVREKTGISTWTVRGNIKGTDGSTWYNGVSNPTTQGVVGDWYIKTSTWDVYRKISSNSWNHYGNIKGEDGVPADISNKANTDGSNTTGGTWNIEELENGFLDTYLYTGYFDNDSIHIPFSDALVDWKGVELGAENVPVMIAEDKTNNYIYRTGLPSNGYPDHAKTGNYLIESKHRFRVHKHENLDALNNGVGKVILSPYNAIEHQYFDVNIFGEMEVLELDIQSPQWDELTGHEIRRNPYGQRISVCVSTNAKVMFTSVQGVQFPNGGLPGVYKYVWDGVWLFDGYSPNEF